MAPAAVDPVRGTGVALAALDQNHDLIAVLDGDGTIVLTNAAWREGADRRDGCSSTTGPGVNYLEVCERSDAAAVADGIRAVLRGERPRFELEYPCHSSIEDTWFLVEVSSLGEPGSGAVVTHTDISARSAADRVHGHPDDVDPVTLLATSPSGVADLARMLADSQARENALAVVTITLTDLGEIESRHGRRFRDHLIIHAAARVFRLTGGEDAIIRPSTNQLIVFSAVADAQGGEFLRDKITQVLSETYLVGATAVESLADVAVVSSDRFSTLDSLLHEFVIERAQAPHADALTPSGAVRSGGDEAARDEAACVPLVVYSLPDGYVQAANEAAQALFSLGPRETGQLHARDIADPTDVRHIAAALAALSSGAADSYRARRTLVTSDGPLPLLTSVRRILIGPGSLAVALTVPADSEEETPSADDWFAVALVAGTIDSSGGITSVSSSSSPMENELAATLTTTLRQAAHPDEVDVVDDMVETTRRRGTAAGVFRVAHSEHGWMVCQCQLFTIKRHRGHDSCAESPPADHELLCFVLSTSVSTKSMVDRIAGLEAHLRHIALEVDAADVGLMGGPTVDHRIVAALDALDLSARQRDIVERLVRGQRVGSIAGSLYISRSTVRNHLSQVYRLVGVHSQEELLNELQSS